MTGKDKRYFIRMKISNLPQPLFRKEWDRIMRTLIKVNLTPLF
jgi:hypothetical protein